MGDGHPAGVVGVLAPQRDPLLAVRAGTVTFFGVQFSPYGVLPGGVIATDAVVPAVAFEFGRRGRC
ncbi:hypothetical protein GS534_24145 [Rhodococcus hoagii]|nr:hypothetical protein [Prescottella equi]